MPSTWIRDTVTEFGRLAGIPDLALSASGTLRLKLEGGDVVALETLPEPAADQVLLYLTRPVGHQLGTLLRAALGRAHHQEASPYPVMVGCHGTGTEALLVAGIRQPERAFTAQGLSHAIEFLGRWMDDVQGGCRA